MKNFSYNFIPAFLGSFAVNKWILQQSLSDATCTALLITCVVALFVGMILDKPVNLV